MNLLLAVLGRKFASGAGVCEVESPAVFLLCWTLAGDSVDAPVEATLVGVELA